MKYFNTYNAVVPLILACIFACACQNSHNKTETIVKELLGKQMQFPDTMKRLSPKDAAIAPVAFEQEKTAVFTYIFGDCSSCIEIIKQWNAFFNQAPFSELQPVMVVYTHDLTGFLWNYRPLKAQNQYPVYLDSNKQLQEINKLPGNPAYHTLLLASTGRTLAVGNPLHNPELERLYKAQIRKQCSLSSKIHRNMFYNIE